MVKTYFEFETQYLIESDEWQHEYADLFLDSYETDIEPLAAAKVSDYSTNEEQLDDERERAIKEIMTCPTHVKIPNFGC